MAILSLGGNLGDREKSFERAIDSLKKYGKVIKQSSLYETEAWGMESDAPSFLNQVLLFETGITPVELLGTLLNIEKELGRDRSEAAGKEGYQSRTIDMDILFYDDYISDSAELIIPHPKLHLRKFVLEPLYELSPEWVHPVSGKTVGQLRAELKDETLVRRLDKNVSENGL